ncbi:expressed unknown protein [Seminavis robusta]|uniref:Uncharacterized protein n=1 Tax=Seminavis robusta TaxID=568900 RepID=A0A9N8DU42_9STRA|nr:expressed unknown protein [Seminavis robusta]|eukprot:Sro280_g107050.1 n/a (236) ;mRNA; r:45673-46380
MMSNNIPLFVIIPSSFNLKSAGAGEYREELQDLDDNESLSCQSSVRSLSSSEDSGSSSSNRWISCVSTNHKTSSTTAVVPPRAPKRLSSLIRDDDSTDDEDEDTNPLQMVRRQVEDPFRLSVRSSDPASTRERKSLDCSPILPRRSVNLPAGTVLLPSLKRAPRRVSTVNCAYPRRGQRQEAASTTPRSETGSTASITTIDTSPPTYRRKTSSKKGFRQTVPTSKPRFPFLQFLP